MDLLVGLWAERNLPSMDDSQLAAMETVLDQENPDLFKWLTGQEEAPQTMQANPAFVVSTCRDTLCGKLFPSSWKGCLNFLLCQLGRLDAEGHVGAAIRNWQPSTSNFC